MKPALAASFLLLLATGLRVHADAPVVIPVDSNAFVFSPGNWVGNDGRTGSKFRQTWNPGAYFRVTWSTTSDHPTASLLLEREGISGAVQLTYSLDGVWTSGVAASQHQLALAGLNGTGNHTLIVYVKSSEQSDRWGSAGASGRNVLRVAGLQVDGAGTPDAQVPAKYWALIIGDSITEGIAANNGDSDSLACWSYFVGQYLEGRGFDYCVSACGFSGWIRPGDSTHDVPPYYRITHSQKGAGGTYDETDSRWDKIDGQHGILDRAAHLSAYGGNGQEPSLILINYATNDVLSHCNSSDIQASITQSLGALRRAAPRAVIDLIVPFGQYGVNELKQGLAAYQAIQPDTGVFLIDLGPSVANALGAGNFWGDLHPNLRGHAVISSGIIAQMASTLKTISP